MVKVGKWIARHRILMLLIGVLLIIPSVIGIAKTKVNYDLLSYLPDHLETVKGQDILVDEFGMGAFSMVAVENMDMKDVQKLENKLSEFDHVNDILLYDVFADIILPIDMLPSIIKDEFFKGMEKYYVDNPETEKSHKFLEKISDKLTIKEPDTNITSETDENIQINEIKNYSNTNNILIAIGSIIFVLSIIEILTIDSGFGIFTLLISVIVLCYGIYKTRDTKETETRTRIIREHLLTLPEEYYVFYNVKIPGSSIGINHVVIGPSGIYALISQKYKAKNKLDSENENLNLIDSIENDEKIEEINSSYGRRFKYTTKQAKFSQDNKIKQKSLILGENLINFLNENNIRHCFVEPLVGFINHEVVVINTPLTDEDLFMEELLHKIEYGSTKLNSETIDKCAVLLNKYSADCSSEF